MSDEQMAKSEITATVYFSKSVALFAALFTVMIVGAGTWHLPFFWLMLILWLLFIIECWIFVDHDLLAERISPRGKDQDRHSIPLLVAVFTLHYLIAALDVGRFHISDSIPVLLQCAAAMLTFAGFEGLIWTMKINRFFSSAIRLQEDRGHHIIESGPYHYVRHPGYAFAAVAFLAEGVMLGSWLSIAPILIMVADFAYRALLEERLLKAELPGYAQYCRKVRYRLCPGLW